MRACDLFERATPSDVFALAKRAKATLGSDAQRAIQQWEAANWTGGALEKHFIAQDAVWQEIDAAFAPVRARLPVVVTLYRGLALDTGYEGWKTGVLNSWTSDRRVAEGFAGWRNHGPGFESYFRDILTDKEIDRLVDAYDRIGYTTYMGRHYVKNKSAPQYYNIYDRHRNFITDGDDIRDEITSWNDDLIERNEETRRRGKVLNEEIDRDRIVWLTNSLNCKEFLVRR
jgi:hypothetical protein